MEKKHNSNKQGLHLEFLLLAVQVSLPCLSPPEPVAAWIPMGRLDSYGRRRLNSEGRRLDAYGFLQVSMLCLLALLD